MTSPWFKRHLLSCIFGVLFLAVLIMWGVSVGRTQIVQFNTPKTMLQLGFQHSTVLVSLRENSHPRNWEFFTHGGSGGSPRPLFPAHLPRVRHYRNEASLSIPIWQIAGLMALVGALFLSSEIRRIRLAQQ